MPRPATNAASATPNRFHNISPEALADLIGDADIAAKECAAELDSLKAEAKRRGLEKATGSRFRFTVSMSETKRLDTTALKTLLGDGLDPYYKTTPTNTLRISPVFEAPELD